MKLTDSIKNEAMRLGFSFAGITAPERPPHFDIFKNWLDNKHHGEMNYLATDRAQERRKNPKLILPECQSILVLALPYSAAKPPEPSTDLTGRIASYAWGDDYHDVIKRRLIALVQFIEKLVGHPVPNRYYTDTGPILERDFAQQAGLGWIGKNTCLINPKSGSYFFLAEIFLGLALKPDPPFTTDHCGSCTRCIDACPTACILPDRTLNASECISYLTIELKGFIPLDLRSEIRDWVFGCDICQEVCPWNIRFSHAIGEPQVSNRLELSQVNLEKEITLSQAEFNEKFKKHPIKRTKRTGYLRNVAVALGNSRASGSIHILKKLILSEEDAIIRGHAAWASGRIGGVQAERLLREALITEKDERVILEINQALTSLGNK